MVKGTSKKVKQVYNIADNTRMTKNAAMDKLTMRIIFLILAISKIIIGMVLDN